MTAKSIFLLCNFNFNCFLQLVKSPDCKNKFTACNFIVESHRAWLQRSPERPGSNIKPLQADQDVEDVVDEIVGKMHHF